MFVRTLSVIMLLSLVLSARAQEQADTAIRCTVKKVRVERLPDLNIPRCEHITLMIDSIPYVFGGHTTGRNKLLIGEENVGFGADIVKEHPARQVFAVGVLVLSVKFCAD